MARLIKGMIKPLLAVFGLIAMTSSAAAEPLDAYRWSHRPVLIFAPDRGDERYGAQSAAFGAAAMKKERDIALIRVAGDDVAAEPRLGTFDAAALRKHFSVADGDFAVILVGKDGLAKWQRDEVVDPAEIFREIDAMPMRRNEASRARP